MNNKILRLAFRRLDPDLIFSYKASSFFLCCMHTQKFFSLKNLTPAVTDIDFLNYNLLNENLYSSRYHDIFDNPNMKFK